uniref:C2H2-type domain-containing protein n=1 Tax=Onchocerca volvulus TaxID=6282 RepID=A0A8R1XRJ5_ONCVO
MNIMNTHNQTHTGEKPCKRNICGKEFNDLSNLNKHNSAHVLEKPFKNKREQQAKNMKMWQRFHTAHVFNETSSGCKRGTVQVRYLRQKIHSVLQYEHA